MIQRNNDCFGPVMAGRIDLDDNIVTESSLISEEIENV
jgi:hypothetical protein